MSSSEGAGAAPVEVKDEDQSYTKKHKRFAEDKDLDTDAEIEHSESETDEGEAEVGSCDGDEQADEKKSEPTKELQTKELQTKELPPKKRRYAPFVFRKDTKTKKYTLRSKCSKCNKIFCAELVDTILKPVDIEFGSIEELDGGHVSLACNIILKRRTFISCTLCGHENKISNNHIDEGSGMVYTNVLQTTLDLQQELPRPSECSYEHDGLLHQLVAGVRSVGNHLTLTSVDTLVDGEDA